MRIGKLMMVIRLSLVISLCLTLCACQTDGIDSDAPEQASQSVVHKLLAQVYMPVIIKNDVEDPIFSLIYLDEDDIPELVILDRYWGKYSMYTIRDNSAECLIDAMTTVEMTYYERKNIISTFFRWNGGGDKGGYASKYYQLDQHSESLTDNSIPSFEFYYNSIYDENGNWTGDGITEYYENGKKIDKTTYNQVFVDLGFSQSGDISCFSERNSCFSKEELLVYLNTESAVEATS